MKKKLLLLAAAGMLGLGVFSVVRAEGSMFKGNSVNFGPGSVEERTEVVHTDNSGPQMQLRGNGSDDVVNGVKLRGDGSVDDNSSISSRNDMVNGVKLRGDGSVDDNSLSHSSGEDGTSSHRRGRN